MNDNQIKGNSNSINDFLDSMGGQVGADPFANESTVPVQEIDPAVNQMPQQISPAVQPTTTWQTEQVRMTMQQKM